MSFTSDTRMPGHYEIQSRSVLPVDESIVHAAERS
jgi:hypothetical protein